MAGSMATIENSVTAITDQFEVEYARFFTYPSPPSTHPALVSISSTRRKRFKGNWMSTSSSTASLKLISGHSRSDAVLLVSLTQKILEEHYVAKLRFSWPQMSCIPGFPARGGRAIFVSYKDSEDQIQKFGLRFLTTYETETFMNDLKEILEDARVAGLGPPCPNFGNEISSQSEFVPSHGLPYRPQEDWSSMTSADTFTQKRPPGLNSEVNQNSCTQETVPNQDIVHDKEGILSAFPPSFTSLLMNCCPAVKKDAAQPSVSKEFDLKAQMMRCLEDSSFQDILCKVEQVISEMGDDLLL